ncbi:hypothetical protein DFAR_2910040 [Desulfarculales bacterium]
MLCPQASAVYSRSPRASTGQRARLLLLTLSKTAECRGPELAAGQALLDQVLQLNHAYVDLILADAQGQVQAFSSPSP